MTTKPKANAKPHDTEIRESTLREVWRHYFDMRCDFVEWLEEVIGKKLRTRAGAIAKKPTVTSEGMSAEQLDYIELRNRLLQDTDIRDMIAEIRHLQALLRIANEMRKPGD